MRFHRGGTEKQLHKSECRIVKERIPLPGWPDGQADSENRLLVPVTLNWRFIASKFVNFSPIICFQELGSIAPGATGSNRSAKALKAPAF